MSPRYRTEEECRADEVTVLCYMLAVALVAFICVVFKIDLRGMGFLLWIF
jgi:hypothetical protein